MSPLRPTEAEVHAHRLARFFSRFPNTRSLKLEPVQHQDGLHELFDLEDVEGVLGAVRFAKFMAGVKTVYSCGHRNHRADHPDRAKAGAEVHCVAAADLEAFLAGGSV